ncbi:MAG TPA: cell division protein FtsZ [Thermoplasmata archaeon]|nr:cell division protein FtsZ [Thermoplasmata archaeon]
MRSIVDAALARHEELVRKEQVRAPDAAKSWQGSPDDAAIMEMAQHNVVIKIVGCGGGGSNTINRLTEMGVTGAEMCAVNTDATHLLHVHAPRKILIGKKITKGLGAGAIPQTGEEAAKESESELKAYLNGSNIVFVTAGMGGGTGTGSAPMVAKQAKEMGCLTMGVVTMPFKGEGGGRMDNAEWGLAKMVHYCDTTITIPNDKLLELVPKLPIEAAFKVADEILVTCIKGITEILTRPGLVNIDYADLLTVMKEGGVAMIGLGESEADRNRLEDAVKEALHSPLLGEVDASKAKGALIRVVGGSDLSISEAEKAAEIITNAINPNARVIWGCTIDPSYDGKVSVLLVLTGVRNKQMMGKGADVGVVSGRAESLGIDSVR